MNKALKILNNIFGYSDFRPGQIEIIKSVLSGCDTLGVMPTGGGKSLCYQVPAMCFPGLTVVISPLISLMKDQIDTLKSKKYPAEMINSTVSFTDQHRIMDDVFAGRVKLLYLTPERLKNEQFVRSLQECKISLFAIDEAHCISEWGHDFRPDYRRLSSVINFLNNPPILALTATATEKVRSDIVKVIGMKNPKVIINGFNRTNLIYGVEKYYRKEDKNVGLVNFLKKVKKPGIIYTSSVKDADEVYNYLRTNTQYNFGVYHGKLSGDKRIEVQDDFLNNKLDILIATNAFGMGVDKSDIRFVVHYTIPGTIEAYYQETGRAGRDGNTSFCLLQYMEHDEKIQRFFIKSKNPAVDRMESLFKVLLKYSKDGLIYEDNEIQENDMKISHHEKAAILKQLSFMGCIENDFLSEDQFELFIKKNKNGEQKYAMIISELERVAGREKTITGSLKGLAKRLDLRERELKDIFAQLGRDKIIDYKIIKAGRIVRVTEKKIPEDKLKVYSDKLVEKIKLDYEKLDAVVGYAALKGNECRRRYLLNYFGEEFSEANCGKCDLCRKTNKEPSGILTDIEKKILLAVLINNGKLGRVKLVKLLKGSYELEEKYREIDEFGMLSNIDIEIIDCKVKSITDAGLLYSDNEKYPTLKISAEGKDVLKKTDIKTLVAK